MPETMKLCGSTKSKITQDENGESVPHLEIPEAVLVHCNIVDNDYQQDVRALYSFVPKSYILLKKRLFLKAFDSEVLHIEVWFTD